MGPLLTAALALGAGLAQAVSLAAPWDGQPRGWLQVASLAVLVALLERQLAPRRRHDTSDLGFAIVTGWWFALGWLGGTFWWLFISMHIYGGLAAPLAAAAVLALAGALGLYLALACGAYFKLFEALPFAGWSFRALVFAALWTLAELARGRWLTGFPWGAAGYAHTDSVLAPLAAWVGVYGTGAVAAWLAAALVARPAAIGGRLAGPLAVGGVVLALAGAGAAGVNDRLTRPAGALDVQLLQGNIPQNEKFEAGTGVADALRWYGAALAGARASLVVAPETALPLLPQQLPDGYWAALLARFGRDGGAQAALLGVPLGRFSEGYTNSAVGLRPGAGAAYRYDKHHLVPFGEFIPTGFRWFTEQLRIPLGDFRRGGVAQPPFVWQGQRLAPNICYEDLFGEELGARFADPDRAPTAFVNLSNIAWFGDSVAIDQHLQISRLRALEFQRPMLRATNTGATVVIDHRGVVTHALPRLTRAVLGARFEGREGLTPYARWVSVAGLAPLWGLCGVVLLAALAVARRR